MSAANRELSPTIALYEQRMSADKARAEMRKWGFHVFDQSWTAFHSASFRTITVKIFKSDEQMEIPCQVCTKVKDLKEVLAKATFTEDVEKIRVIRKSGSYWSKLNDNHEVPNTAIVTGITSFKAQPYKYAHPAAILGGGYNGLKAAMIYLSDKNENFVGFDRYNTFGGTAWLTQANKTSKLQTDLAAFSQWFGPEWGEDPMGDNKLGYPRDWSTWPKKDEVIAHINHAADRLGVRCHYHFETNISGLEMISSNEGAKRNPYLDVDRYYSLVAEPIKKGPPSTVNVSSVWHFPGAYFTPRQIIYPGEETFTGKIGFGMADDIPYYDIPGNRVAILGNGAFGVENIRTSVEYGAEMVYMVTRRRNMPMPRMCCWFVHQAITPTPASMLLNMIKPFYTCARDFMDPWTSHQTYPSKDRATCTISSNSRFGIGDVTFLAIAWGRCEYHEDVVKRMSGKTLHLSLGSQLDGVGVVIKALGLLADFTADKLHKIKETIGLWPNGDGRRYVMADPLGMHAANFTTMSTGIGSYGMTKTIKYFIDFPTEWRKGCELGLIAASPRSVGDDNKPNLQVTAKHQTAASMLVESLVPHMAKVSCASVDDYMHRAVNDAHPLERTWEECLNGWKQYQEEWRAQGFDHPWVPYPISREDVSRWYEEYEQNVGPLRPEDKADWYDKHLSEQQKAKFAAMMDTGGNDDSKAWWSDNSKKVRAAH